MVTPRVEDLHAGLRSLLAERIGGGETVLLAARAGMGSDALAAAVLHEEAGFMLDTLAGGADMAMLAHALTRQVIASLQPLPLRALSEPGREAEQARVQLARHYEGDLAVALLSAASPTEAAAIGWTITRALGPLPGNPLLVVMDAHRVPAAGLWELRELAGRGIRLLLLSSPERRARLDGRDAPFYGMGVSIEMPTVSRVVWQTKVGGLLSGDALGELLRATRYRTALALEILDRHAGRGGERPIASAFSEAVDARVGQAREVLNLAHSVHELAPRLLLALAAGEPPYKLHAARSDRVALALRHLRDHDLIEQQRPRSWQIADPLLCPAIRRLWQGEGAVEPDLDIGAEL
jgi:hypothetical protein